MVKLSLLIAEQLAVKEKEMAEQLTGLREQIARLQAENDILKSMRDRVGSGD